MKRIAVTALLCAACTGTETGNPAQIELRFDAHTSDPAVAEVASDGGGAIVRELWLGLDELRLVPDMPCEGPGQPAIGAVGVADHAQAGALERAFTIEPGFYCRATTALLAATELPPDAPAELLGASVVMIGESASGTPFILVDRQAPAVDLVAVDGAFELSGDGTGLFFGLDVGAWLSDIDIDAGVADGDGTIVISSETNQALQASFRENLARGIELYRDVDRNGRVDGPEDALLARGQ